MDQEFLHRWFSHTGDLVAEHIDDPTGCARLYFISSMADAKVVYSELIPKLREIDQDRLNIDHVERHLGLGKRARACGTRQICNQTKNFQAGKYGWHCTMSTLRKKALAASPPVFDVRVRLQARILELTIPIKLEDSKMMKTMEDALEKEIEKELQKVVKKLQQLDVDPAGFGIVYRAQQRGLKETTNRDWRKIFRQASVRFHVQATIIRNGVID